MANALTFVKTPIEGAFSKVSAGRVCQVRICTAHCFDMAVAGTERVPRKTRVAEAENNWGCIETLENNVVFALSIRIHG
jgi:hypothetical protein